MPADTPPKIIAPFEDARANLAGRSLAAHADGDRVVVDDDPLGMVASVRPGALVDRHGNTLWVAPAAAVMPPVEVDAPDIARPPPWARFEMWTLVTVGSLGSGIYSAWKLDDAQDEWDRLKAEDGEHDFSELQRVENRGRTFATMSNIFLGASAVTGTVAVICLWRELRRPHVDDTVTVTGSVTHGAAVLGIAGRF